MKISCVSLDQATPVTESAMQPYEWKDFKGETYNGQSVAKLLRLEIEAVRPGNRHTEKMKTGEIQSVLDFLSQRMQIGDLQCVQVSFQLRIWSSPVLYSSSLSKLLSEAEFRFWGRSEIETEIPFRFLGRGRFVSAEFLPPSRYVWWSFSVQKR